MAKLKPGGVRETINETNRMFSDFKIKERLIYDEWKDSSLTMIENHRKDTIKKYLDIIEDDDIKIKRRKGELK